MFLDRNISIILSMINRKYLVKSSVDCVVSLSISQAKKPRTYDDLGDMTIFEVMK